MDSHQLFSHKRLESYENEQQHIQNFLLIQKIAPKLGLIEIVIRNRVAKILQIGDDSFISSQTFGYWCKKINDSKIHNHILDFHKINMAHYSALNIKDKLRHYQRVQLIISLLQSIRNRAFHFENLLKIKPNGYPRLSAKIMAGNREIIAGIEPQYVEKFIDDILESLDGELKYYLK